MHKARALSPSSPFALKLFVRPTWIFEFFEFFFIFFKFCIECTKLELFLLHLLLLWSSLCVLPRSSHFKYKTQHIPKFFTTCFNIWIHTHDRKKTLWDKILMIKPPKMLFKFKCYNLIKNFNLTRPPIDFINMCKIKYSHLEA